MPTHTFRKLLIAGLACVALAGQAWSQTGSLELITVAGQGAVPYGVQIETHGDRATVSGQLVKSSANPSRRLNGRVVAEVLDRGGRVVATRFGDARRVSPAKHTQRARFDIEIDDLPADAAALRISYQ